VTSFAADIERRLQLEGCFNFRDLGGYQTIDGRHVRWRRLFRADGLHRLTEADHRALHALGLATVIDLRTVDEVTERGRFSSPIATVDYHHLPMIDVIPPREELPTWIDPAVVSERYGEMLVEGEDSIREVLALLTDPASYPAVFHCTAGRDRTGIVAALVLSLLGVPDHVIVADYAMSQESMAAMLAWLRTQYGDSEELDRYAPAMLSVMPEAMGGLLAAVRRSHGSTSGFADFLDMGGAVKYLRAALLE
jgi:protein-tyrosine phosphatase